MKNDRRLIGETFLLSAYYSTRRELAALRYFIQEFESDTSARIRATRICNDLATTLLLVALLPQRRGMRLLLSRNLQT
jgi:hypothetical protein